MSAVLNGLVLAGGQSRRMGTDKFGLRYRGVRQGDRAIGLLRRFCQAIYVSRRPEQGREGIPHGIELLRDRYCGIGPLGGVLTALEAFPGCAWLVLACDLPELDETVLATLVNARNGREMATAFASAEDGRPEPLCAVYEPGARPHVRRELERGTTSLRRILSNGDARIVPLPVPFALKNINTRKDYENVR